MFDVTETGFDVATVYGAYPHFPDKQRLAGKIADMLIPGGRIVIAHSDGKETINARHRGADVSQMSAELLPAKEEAENLTERFRIDTLVDTPGMYIVSGVRR